MERWGRLVPCRVTLENLYNQLGDTNWLILQENWSSGDFFCRMPLDSIFSYDIGVVQPPPLAYRARTKHPVLCTNVGFEKGVLAVASHYPWLTVLSKIWDN